MKHIITDHIINKIYFVIIPIMFGISTAGLFFTIQTNQQLKKSIASGQESRDSQLKTIKNNQDTLLCVTKGFLNPANYQEQVKDRFIDQCVKDNQ